MAATEIYQVVEEIDCATAPKLLALLSPLHDFWHADPTEWIFRGHASAEWSLLATAHRRDVDPYAKWGITGEQGIESGDWLQRRAAELDLLGRFRKGLDGAGLGIPLNPLASYEYPEVTHLGEIRSDALPILALAQHWGLPTSLLDWTRIAGKAAYFAAADPKAHESTGQLAVWALKETVLTAGIFANELELRVVVAPLASNPNMHAQSGLFTQSRGEKIVTVDDHLRRQFKEFSKDLTPRFPLPWIRKLSLPRSEARSLLRILSYMGIHGSSMFPGPDGVVRRMREEAIWRSLS
ncbi:MAG TPA: FRG domain-containing protein [Fimbriimonas sp.]|nr:FRG domain-containing protein [Fimbriimonas sp.]